MSSSILAIGGRNIFSSATEVEALEAEKKARPDKGCCAKVKRVFQKAIDEFVNALKHVVEFFAHSVGTHSNMQSIAKFGKSSILFVKYVFQRQADGFNNLHQTLETVDSTIDLFDFIVDIKEWFSSKDHSDGKEKPLWRHEGVTKWKLVSKAFGTVAKGLGSFKFLLDVGLLSLGKLSAAMSTVPFLGVILQFSPLRVIKDSLAAISAILVTVDHSIHLHQERKLGKIEEQKLKKWKIHDNVREFLALSKEEKIVKLDKEFKGTNYEGKSFEDKKTEYLEQQKKGYLAIRQALKDLGAKPKVREVSREEITPEEKWAKNVKAYKKPNEATKTEQNQQCTNKFEEHNKALSNKKILQNKNWFAIAFNIAKVAAIVLGLVGVFAAAVAGNVYFIAAVATLWFITSTIGMVRVYYSFKHQNVHS